MTEADTPEHGSTADDMAATIKRLETYWALLDATNDIPRDLSRALKGMGRPTLCDGERGLSDARAEAGHEIADLRDAIARFEEEEK